jgi:hypothetical protein
MGIVEHLAGLVGSKDNTPFGQATQHKASANHSLSIA